MKALLAVLGVALATAASAFVAAATVAWICRREPEYACRPWAEPDDGWGIGV